MNILLPTGSTLVSVEVIGCGGGKSRAFSGSVLRVPDVITFKRGGGSITAKETP